MTDQATLDHEQTQVDRVYARADDVLEELAADSQGAHQAAAQEVRRQREERRARLDALVGNDDQLVALARVDLAEPDDDERTFYLGRTSLLGPDRSSMLVSWQSRLGKELFYDEGTRLRRKLSFEGRDRTIEQVIPQVWSAGQLDETVSGDPLLERLRQTLDGELRNAVLTIQKHQYELMEADAGTTMVIQGAPGSGKTIIGLHRISMIVHRAEGDLLESDILVVGPSAIFLDYVGGLLPSLGNGRVPQVSISQLGRPSEVRVTGTDTVAAERVKGSRRMADVIERYLDGRLRFDDETLELGDGRIPGSEIRDIIVKSKQRHGSYNGRRAFIRDRVLEAAGLRADGLTADLRRQLENAMNRIAETRSQREVVASILSSRNLLAEAAQGLLSAAERAEILRDEQRLGDVAWTTADLALLDEAAQQLDGRDRDLTRYRHIVVDEAQDLSPMQLRMLQRRSRGGMTILGDLAQGTSPWRSLTWEQHLTEKAGITIDMLQVMSQVYRTTQPLMSLSNRLLDSIDVAVPDAESVMVDGDAPTMTELGSVDDLATSVATRIEDVLTSADPGTIGVIGPADVLARLTDELTAWGDDMNVEVAHARESLRSTVTLVPASEAKGLEFDHVVLVEAGQLYRSDAVTGPSLLYVAMTRARTGLHLIHTSRPPRMLVTALDGEHRQPTDSSLVSTPKQGPIHTTTSPPAEEALDPSKNGEVVAAEDNEVMNDAVSQAIASSDETSAIMDRVESTGEGGANDNQSEGDPDDIEPEPSAVEGSWFIVAKAGTYMVRVDDDAVGVSRVPTSSSPMEPLANGYLMRTDDVTTWMLRTSAGHVVTVTTGPIDTRAVEGVIAEVEKPH